MRDRAEDIPALAAHFAMRAAKRLGMPPLVPSADDIRALVSYPWPGNVRELAAVIERAAILGGGARLEVARALGTAPLRSPARPLEVGSPDARSEADAEPLTLDAAMARHIEAALVRTRGRIEGSGGAAALLGINPHTLRAHAEARRGLAPLPRRAAVGGRGPRPTPVPDRDGGSPPRDVLRRAGPHRGGLTVGRG